MKTVNVVFEDREWDQLNEMKGDKSWHDFMLLLLNNKNKK
jgi:predicted CopG family antitoxin